MKSQVKKIRTHISPGLIIGLIALLVALGGTSIAAKKKSKALPANSAGAKQLKDTQVRTAGGSVAPGTLGDFTANCNTGEQLVGGGVVRASSTTALQLLESGAKGNGWHGQVYSTSAAAHVVTVQALCIPK